MFTRQKTVSSRLLTPMVEVAETILESNLKPIMLIFPLLIPRAANVGIRC